MRRHSLQLSIHDEPPNDVADGRSDHKVPQVGTRCADVTVQTSAYLAELAQAFRTSARQPKPNTRSGVAGTGCTSPSRLTLRKRDRTRDNSEVVRAGVPYGAREVLSVVATTTRFRRPCPGITTGQGKRDTPSRTTSGGRRAHVARCTTLTDRAPPRKRSQSTFGRGGGFSQGGCRDYR